jgi:signal transduction histidine kinase
LLRVLADEQAALRRVATLVARGTPPEEVFAAVTEEAGRLLDVEYTYMARYERGRMLAVVGSWGGAVDSFPVGTRAGLGGRNLVTIVFETGHSARIDDYAEASGSLGAVAREGGVRSAVGTPITVEGRVWGAVVAGTRGEQPLPADTEARLANFTELLATAIANAESRAGLARLVEEQAALRRVATLVARGTAPPEVFAAVTEEVGQLLPVDFAALGRYEHDRALVVYLATWRRTGGQAALRRVATLVARGTPPEEGGPVAPVGTRMTLGGRNVSTLVFETGRPARVDRHADASGALAVVIRDLGIRSAVGTPITVEGRLWGVVGVGATLEQPLRPDTEARLASFTKLVATAIANAENHAALGASRSRLVAAADETRRQIERDLHDGVQQRLVSLILELRAAEAVEHADVVELRAHLARTARGVSGILEELHEISRGIHPAILSRGGLERAVRTLAHRSSLPVELDLHVEHGPPEPVEVAAYYVIAEALTNAAKHAQASSVQVGLHVHDAILQLMVRDDGIGGAQAGRGSGLVGLSDRIETLGGTLQLTSPPGGGTTLSVEIPLDGQRSPALSGP